MSERKTEIIFLLDRSGSMSGLETDTIGGFNALVEKQCKLDGETRLTTVLFDHEYEMLWEDVDASTVRLTEKEYFVRGTTALLDAVGKTIIDSHYRISNDKNKPDNVLFVITTDGMENASKEFTYAKVKEMILNQQDKGDWEFIFLGANIDVAKEADNLGIRANQSFHFEATDAGVKKMYEVINEELSIKRMK